MRQPPPGLGAAARNRSGSSRAGARVARPGDPPVPTQTRQGETDGKGRPRGHHPQQAGRTPLQEGRGRRPRAGAAAHPRRRADRQRHRPDGTEYRVDFTDEEYRGLYRDLVRGPQARRRGDRPAAPGRAGHLGQPARPGGGPGRLRPGAAHAGHGLPDLPRARRALLPGHRPDHAAGPVPRRRPGRLGPERVQVQHVHDRHRRADPARDRLRDGHHHGRQGRHRRRRGGDRLLRRRRHQPGRRERGVRLGQRLQRADRVLLPEQPVRDLRAAGAADPGPALPAGRRLRLPRRTGRRQRRAGLLRGDPHGAGQRPARPGPDA